MVNIFKKNLLILSISAVTGIVLLSSNALGQTWHGESYDESNRAIKESSFQGFWAWVLAMRVERVQSEVDANTLAIQDNLASISEIKTKVDGTTGTTANAIELNVDCSEDPAALASAYNENLGARDLTIYLSGECFGDFQTQSNIAPNLTLIASTDNAGIIANPTTGKTALSAFKNSLSLVSLNIVGGENDVSVIKANYNSSLNMNNVLITANALGDYIIRVTESSSADLDNVQILGNDLANRGLAVQGNSKATATLLDVSGTIEDSVNITEASVLRLAGTVNLSQQMRAFGAHFRTSEGAHVIANGVRLYGMSSIIMTAGSHITSNALFGMAGNSNVKSYSLEINADLTVEKGSYLRSSDTGAVLLINGGRLRVREGSGAILSEGTIIATSPSSYSLDISGGSNVVFKPSETSTPFALTGRSKVFNSTIEGTNIVFEQKLSLNYASTAIINADAMLVPEEINDVSQLFFQ